MKLADIRTHAQSYRAMAKFLGARDHRPIANHTIVIRRTPGAIALRHFSTALATHHANGSTSIRSYNSVTSQRRINLVLTPPSAEPRSQWGIYNQRGAQILWFWAHPGNRWPTGCTAYLAGHVPVTIWPDGRTDAEPRRPRAHRAMCRCSRCYYHCRYYPKRSGWKKPWRDAEQTWMLLTQSAREESA